MKTQFIATALLVLSLFPLPAVAHDLSEEDAAKIKELAIEAILENPAVIEQAITRLRELRQEKQAKEIQTTITRRRDELFNDPNAPVVGNPDGDVTVVEFFDYNCPYCKRAAPIVEQLLEKDAGVRLVYREFPILSDGSLFAARAALASRMQDKYAEYHQVLMNLTRVDEDSAIEAASEIGLDVEQLRTDMDRPEVEQHIKLSMELANALGITGTPSFVIGNEMAPGLVQLSQMQSMVDNARGLRETKASQ